jgi:flagellar biosynthesis regulator FlaF
MISTQTTVADAQGNRDLHPSMENAIAAYLRARDQYLQSMDALDAFVYATNVLYAAFAEDIGIADRRVLCEAFQAFRRELIRQHDANQAAIRITDFQ